MNETTAIFMVVLNVFISILVTISTVWIKNINKRMRATEDKELIYSGTLGVHEDKIEKTELAVIVHTDKLDKVKGKVNEIITVHNIKNEEKVKILEW